MGLLGPKRMALIAGFLLRRAWGRRLVAEAAEHIAKEEGRKVFSPEHINSAIRAVIGAPVYLAWFVLGAIDMARHPSRPQQPT